MSVQLPQVSVRPTHLAPFCHSNSIGSWVTSLGLNWGSLRPAAGSCAGQRWDCSAPCLAAAAAPDFRQGDTVSMNRKLYAVFLPIPPKGKDHPIVCFLFLLCWQRRSTKCRHITPVSIVMAVSVLPVKQCWQYLCILNGTDSSRSKMGGRLGLDPLA